MYAILNRTPERRKPVKPGFFGMFLLLAAGFMLHIDPLDLRSRKKMPSPAITWVICIILALASGMVLR